MEQFKFKIGDTVKHRLLDSKGSPFLVIGRIVEECEGGVQRFYKCRQGVVGDKTFNLIPAGISTAILTLAEMELEAI